MRIKIRWKRYGNRFYWLPTAVYPYYSLYTPMIYRWGYIDIIIYESGTPWKK